MINLDRLRLPPDFRHLSGAIPPHLISLAALSRVSGPVVAALAVGQEEALAPKWKALAVRVAEAITPDLTPVAELAVKLLGEGDPAGSLKLIDKVRQEVLKVGGRGEAHFSWPVALGAVHTAALSIQCWDAGRPALAARWLAEAIDAALALQPDRVNAVCLLAFNEVQA